MIEQILLLVAIALMVNQYETWRDSKTYQPWYEPERPSDPCDCFYCRPKEKKQEPVEDLEKKTQNAIEPS
ncbi:hypothetical protein J4219_02655 [Candidatus Woesearchaeota archaeon]|nr:hypothetical protein [Candidatus Woesearchaeota archaeon]